MSDDGFITIEVKARKTALRDNEVGFSRFQCSFPTGTTGLELGRVLWQWDGNGTLRARFCDDGGYRLLPSGNAQHRRSVAPVQQLYRTIGRTLKGRYPITRIDGSDVYIDISGEPS